MGQGVWFGGSRLGFGGLESYLCIKRRDRPIEGLLHEFLALRVQGTCSVLQCVVVCCSALQCVAAVCGALQCVAVWVVVCCSELQYVAVCSDVVQHVAACCSILQRN